MRLWLLLLALSASAADRPAASVDDLAWLAGCWSLDGGEAGSGESWTPPAGGTMLGVSRTVKDGRTVAFEFLRIVETGDGGVAYVASPSGQPTTRFELVSAGDTEAVFENPEHDFPQRVIYRLPAGNRLLGRIEGTAGGRERAVDFPMTKSRCPG